MAGTVLSNTFRDYFRRIAPRVLKGNAGDRKFGVIALLFDELVDGVRQAVRLRFPDTFETPSDALPYLARNFAIPWIPNETELSYRQGLAAKSEHTDSAPGKILIDGATDLTDPNSYIDSEERATGVWRRQLRRGSRESIIEELARCGIAAEVEESANYDSGAPYAFDRGFSKGFQVLTTPRFRYRIRVYGYDDCHGYVYTLAPPYGSQWHYGVNGEIPYEVVESVKAVCKHYGPARSRLEAIRCVSGAFSNGFDLGFDSVFIAPSGFNQAFDEQAF